MTLIQSASLLITPTGFKVGDIYTAKPNNTASGDFQFVRNSPGYVFTSQSQFVTRSVDVPRLTYNSGSTYPSTLIERQSLNEIGLSGTPYVTASSATKAWRDGINYLLQTQSIAPIAGLPATRFTYTGSKAGSAQTGGNDITGSLAYRLGTLPGSGHYTLSTVVRQGNVRNLWMYLSAFGWATGSATTGLANPQIAFDFESRIFTSSVSDNYYTASYEKLDNANSYKLNITFNHSGSTATRFIYLAPTTGSTGPLSLRRYLSASFYHEIAYLQLERGFGSTSYIETPNSASVTRTADSLFRTSSSDLIGQQEGTIYVQANLPTAPISASNPIILGLSYPIPAEGAGPPVGAGPFVYICREESSKITVHVSGSTPTGDTVILTSPLSYSGSVRIAVAYSSSNSKLYINGAPVDTSTDPLTFGNPLSRIDIGSWYGGQQGNASIDYAALWKTRLTDLQLAEITS
jgi:hypothetical protein